MRKMRGMEAELAKAKLESEGIECFIADQLISVANPWLFSEVRLQVREDEIHLARDILDRPADDTREGEYTDEAWRCPQCHRKTVDLLPLSSGWQWARLVCLIMMLTPLLLALLVMVLPNPEISDAVNYADRNWGLLWLLALAVIGTALLLAKRQKRCRTCGHEWADGRSKETGFTQPDEADSDDEA